MADGHGRNSVVKLDDRTGSLATITRYLQKFSFKRVAGPAETTAMGDKGAHRIAGLVDASADGSGFANPTFDGILDHALSRAKSLEWHPRGTSSGRVKYTGEFITSSYDLEIAFDGPVTCSFSAEAAGPVARGAN